MERKVSSFWNFIFSIILAGNKQVWVLKNELIFEVLFLKGFGICTFICIENRNYNTCIYI